ncbi:MAG TPA: hypothetical protein P5204_12185, partial [Kiritimatiellia bacterium]|nr:hypothetical protein [Kiritimatiellia bacterium]
VRPDIAQELSRAMDADQWNEIMGNRAADIDADVAVANGFAGYDDRQASDLLARLKAKHPEHRDVQPLGSADPRDAIRAIVEIQRGLAPGALRRPTATMRPTATAQPQPAKPDPTAGVTYGSEEDQSRRDELVQTPEEFDAEIDSIVAYFDAQEAAKAATTTTPTPAAENAPTGQPAAQPPPLSAPQAPAVSGPPSGPAPMPASPAAPAGQAVRQPPETPTADRGAAPSTAARLRQIADEIGYDGPLPRTLADANRIVKRQVERSNELQKTTNKMVRDYEKRGMSSAEAWAEVEKTPEWREFVSEKPKVERFQSVFVEDAKPAEAAPAAKPPELMTPEDVENIVSVWNLPEGTLKPYPGKGGIIQFGRMPRNKWNQIEKIARKNGWVRTSINEFRDGSVQVALRPAQPYDNLPTVSKKPPELMTRNEFIAAGPDGFDNYGNVGWDNQGGDHAVAVAQAIDNHNPILASNFSQYRDLLESALKEGYVRSGDRYVYQPNPQESPNAVSQQIPAKMGLRQPPGRPQPEGVGQQDRLQEPAATGQAQEAPAGRDRAEVGETDYEKWSKARTERIKQSKAAGNVHLDQIPLSVETMRGKRIYNVNDPKERGIIRTVDNRGGVWVYWDDEYSAKANLASPQKETNKAWRKKYGVPEDVMESSLGPSDMEGYAIAEDQMPPRPAPPVARMTKNDLLAELRAAGVADRDLRGKDRAALAKYAESVRAGGEVAPVQASAAKESWQMTRAEYARGAKVRRDMKRNYVIITGPDGKEVITRTLEPGQPEKGLIEGAHRVEISEAIASGKPVPKEVLADYPELMPVAPEKPKVQPSGLAVPAVEGRGDKYADWKAKEQIMAIAPAGSRSAGRLSNTLKEAGVPHEFGPPRTLGSKRSSLKIPNTPEAINIVRRMGGTISKQQPHWLTEDKEPYEQKPTTPAPALATPAPVVTDTPDGVKGEVPMSAKAEAKVTPKEQ